MKSRDARTRLARNNMCPESLHACVYVAVSLDALNVVAWCNPIVYSSLFFVFGEDSQKCVRTFCLLSCPCCPSFSFTHSSNLIIWDGVCAFVCVRVRLGCVCPSKNVCMCVLSVIFKPFSASYFKS